MLLSSGLWSVEIGSFRRFGGTCFSHIQDRRINARLFLYPYVDTDVSEKDE
jgi:hypothetical protein